MTAAPQHATREFARTVQAERLADAARRRPAVDGADLEHLLSAAAAGDQRAWNTLVERFQPTLLRIACARGLTRAQAEDAVQETWMRLLRNVERVREPRALGGWLSTTAVHESARIRVRTARELPSAEDLCAAVPDTTEFDAELQLDAAAREHALRDALRSLPARHQRLLQALFGEAEPSYREIAAELDMPVGSIGPIRRRCLTRLRLHGRLRELAE